MCYYTTFACHLSTPSATERLRLLTRWEGLKALSVVSDTHLLNQVRPATDSRIQNLDKMRVL